MTLFLNVNAGIITSVYLPFVKQKEGGRDSLFIHVPILLTRILLPTTRNTIDN